MTKELQTNSVFNTMKLGEKEQKAVKKIEDENKTFIDAIKPTYKLSDHYPDGAKVGEFYFKEQSFSKDMEVVIPYYGYQVLAMNAVNPKKFEGCTVFPYTQDDYYITKEYKEFMEKHEANSKIQSGLLFLCYVVNIDSFGAFFCKGTLESGAAKIIHSMIIQKTRNFVLTLSQPEGKNYLLLSHTALKDDIPKDLTVEKLNKAIKMFLRADIKKEDTENVQKGR